MERTEIKGVMKDFIIHNFIYGGNDIELNNDTSLMEIGIIDSTGVLELIEFMEEKFEITIENNEIVPENLDSLDNLERYIYDKKKG